MERIAAKKKKKDFLAKGGRKRKIQKKLESKIANGNEDSGTKKKGGSAIGKGGVT